MKKLIYKLFFIAIFSYLIYSSCIYAKVFIGASKVNEVQNQEFVRFQIFGKSENGDEKTISARFSITDDRGYEFTQIERSWNGNYLAIEFCQAKLGDKYFIFPKKIFAKERIIESVKLNRQGTELERYYNENNECYLIGNQKQKKQRNFLYTISRFANKKYAVPTLGFVSTYVIDLSNCSSDVYYSISCDRNGKLILLQM